MYEAEKYHGVTIYSAQEEYDVANKRNSKCDVEFSVGDAEPSDYARIGVENCE